MKKLFSIITVIALALSLTACRDPKKSSEPSDPSKPSELYSGGRGFYYDGTSEGLQSLYEQALAELPDEIPLPDGTFANKTEAAGFSLEMNAAYFDFAFIRYAEPIYECTLDDPGIIDLNTFEPRSDIPRELKSPEWIKVQAGDVLENGLKVVSAQTPCTCQKYNDGSAAVILYAGRLRLEGEITYEGVFKYFNGSKAYGSGDYYLEFYPDSTKYRIPVTYEGDPTEPRSINTETVNLGSNQALVYDGANFRYFRFENDFKDLLKEDTVGKAKMTFNDIVVFGAGFLDGEITDAELDF